jgi:hypothetical protein
MRVEQAFAASFDASRFATTRRRKSGHSMSQTRCGAVSEGGWFVCGQSCVDWPPQTGSPPEDAICATTRQEAANAREQLIASVHEQQNKAADPWTRRPPLV